MAMVGLSSSDLLECSRKITAAADKIDKALANLERYVSQDTMDLWEGDSAEKFRKKFEELRAIFPRFKEAARSYGLFLNDVVDVYQKRLNDVNL